MTCQRCLTAPLALLALTLLAASPACKGEETHGANAAQGQVGKAQTPAPDPDEEEAEGVAPGEGEGSPTAADESGDPPIDEASDEADDGDEAESGPAEPLPDTFEALDVAICDQYVADYEACIADKVPEGEREAQRRLVFDNLESWKQTKAGGEAAERALPTACRIAREQAKAATADWGCEW